MLSRLATTTALLLSMLATSACAITEGSPQIEPAPELREIRGVWITNVDSDVLTSKEKIAEAMDALHAAGINVVYPVVWNKALTLYPSSHAEPVTGHLIDPLYGERDPLQELIVEAHRVGIEVIPWFEYGFATSYNLGGGPILERRPEWASLDAEGNLTKKNNFEWMDALNPEVQEFMAGMILEVARRYDIDGIQGDDRLPALPSLGGYNKHIREAYKAEFGKEPPANEKDPQWLQWRADILTEWLASLRERVKAIDENLTISMSPSYYPWALEEYLQDSKTWVERGLVDTLHPQAYRRTFEDYKKVIDNIVENQFTEDQLSMLAPGLLVKSGPWRIDNEYFLDAINYNRSRGVNGEIHFFYTGLRENDDELLKVLADGPYKERAALPYRETPRRPGGIMFEFDEINRLIKGEVSVASLPEQPAGATPHGYVRISVPKSAIYDIYAEAPPSAEHAALSYDVAGETMTIDPRNPLHTGWVKIGQQHLDANTTYHARVQQVAAPDEKTEHVLIDIHLPQGEEKPVVLGDMMLLLNRKQSPEVEWR